MPRAQDAPHPDLAGLLAAAVDATTPAMRLAAADALAKRADVSLADWLAAARAFGRFSPCEPGERCHRVDLEVLGKTEATDLWVSVPASYDPKRPAPLLFAAHGTGGRGEGLGAMWRGVAERLGMIVLAPTEAGANVGYGVTPRERAAAWAALRWARRNFNIDENRISITGISRGGHLAWDLALRCPDRFAVVAPMIGGPRVNPAGGQNNLRYLDNLWDATIRDLQGAKDDPRLVLNVRLAFAKLKALGAQRATLHEFADLGHSFDLAAVDWAALFATTARSPAPPRVVRSYACPGEGRAFWCEVLAAEPDVREDVPLRLREAEWARLQADDAAMRRYLDEQASARTARLEVVRAGGNRFEVRTQRVLRFRLLLTEAMVDLQRPAVVAWRGKSSATLKETKCALSPSPRVLLREFVERFDRSFLPIAECELR